MSQHEVFKQVAVINGLSVSFDVFISQLGIVTLNTQIIDLWKSDNCQQPIMCFKIQLNNKPSEYDTIR